MDAAAHFSPLRRKTDCTIAFAEFVLLDLSRWA
jgi:hypothetical protein